MHEASFFGLDSSAAAGSTSVFAVVIDPLNRAVEKTKAEAAITITAAIIDMVFFIFFLHSGWNFREPRCGAFPVP